MKCDSNECVSILSEMEIQLSCEQKKTKNERTTNEKDTRFEYPMVIN